MIYNVEKPSCQGIFRVCETAGLVQAVRYFDSMDFRTPDNTDAPPTDEINCNYLALGIKSNNKEIVIHVCF